MVFRLLFLSFCYAISGLAYAHQTPSDRPCSSFLEPSPIEFTPRPDQPHELELGGQVYSTNNPLPPLGTGAYNYVIVQGGWVALGPKYQEAGAIKHKALLRQLAKTLNLAIENVPVLAAGELSLAFNQVTLLNNRSGNLKGEASRVGWAETIFRKMGLMFTEDSQRMAYKPDAKEMDGHTPKGVAIDVFQLGIHRHLAKNSQAQKWKIFFEELGRTLIPLTRKKSAMDISNLIIDAAVAGKRWEGIHEITYPFIHACTVDGFEFGLNKIIEIGFTAEQARAQIQNLMDSQPNAREKLAAVASLIP